MLSALKLKLSGNSVILTDFTINCNQLKDLSSCRNIPTSIADEDLRRVHDYLPVITRDV